MAEELAELFGELAARQLVGARAVFGVVTVVGATTVNVQLDSDLGESGPWPVIRGLPVLGEKVMLFAVPGTRGYVVVGTQTVLVCGGPTQWTLGPCDLSSFITDAYDASISGTYTLTFPTTLHSFGLIGADRDHVFVTSYFATLVRTTAFSRPDVAWIALYLNIAPVGDLDLSLDVTQQYPGLYSASLPNGLHEAFYSVSGGLRVQISGQSGGLLETGAGYGTYSLNYTAFNLNTATGVQAYRVELGASINVPDNYRACVVAVRTEPVTLDTQSGVYVRTGIADVDMTTVGFTPGLQIVGGPAKYISAPAGMDVYFLMWPVAPAGYQTLVETDSAVFAAETLIPGGGGGTVYDDTQTYLCIAGNSNTQGQHFTITVPAGMAHLSVQTLNSGSGDSDLFLSAPGNWNGDSSNNGIIADYGSTGGTMDEFITVDNPVAGVWDIVYCPYNQPNPQNYDLRIRYDNNQPDTYAEPPIQGPYTLAVPVNTEYFDFGVGSPSNPSGDPVTNDVHILVYPPGCWSGDVNTSTALLTWIYPQGLTKAGSYNMPIDGDWTFVVWPVRMLLAETLTFTATAYYP